MVELVFCYFSVYVGMLIFDHCAIYVQCTSSYRIYSIHTSNKRNSINIGMNDEHYCNFVINMTHTHTLFT